MVGSRSRQIAATLLLWLSLVIGCQAPALAGSHEQKSVSLDEAIALVREKSGGKVLRAETRQRERGVVHEIRVLTEDGHVRTFVVDGRTGKVK